MTILVLLLAFTFSLFASSVNAQTPIQSGQTSTSSANNLQTPISNLPATVSPTSPLYTDLLVNNLFHTFSCLAIGQSLIGQPCLTYQITKNAQGAIQGIPVLSSVNTSGGVLGTTTNLIGMLYANPPIRTADYLASIGTGLGIVKEAHAQVGGSGAGVLSPILSLWTVSRNISYVLLILIFLVIGLMVMFRNKLNPQTVITAQTALPGLIIGLILITFSYFFAGLISDMAFVGTNIVGYYFQAAQQTPPAGTSTCTNSADLVTCTKDQSVLTIFSKFVGILRQDDAAHAIDSIFNSFTEEVQNYLRLFAGIMAFQFGSQAGIVGGPWGFVVGPILGFISAAAIQTSISPILGLVISLLVVAILIFTMLKLLLRLVNCYINILVLTITAPFQFLAAALPGRQGMATGWVLSMLCNVLAFPAVIAVFYLVNYLMGGIANSPFLAVGTAPSITGPTTFPLFGGMDISMLRIVVALGALMATPAIPDLLCKALGRASQAGQLIGQEISGGIRSGRGYGTQVGTGAFGAARSTGTGIFGETQYQIQGGRVIPWTTKVGARHIPQITKGGLP